MRIAFVGQQAYFGYIALEEPTANLTPRFFELHPDDDGTELRAGLDEYAPEVVFVFRPEFLAQGALHGLNAIRVGWLTEPLPRGEDPHPDLATRLEYLRRIDPGNYDRIIAFEPNIVPAASKIIDVWRSVPLPCTDRLFADVRETRSRPKFLFTGRSTPHRDAFLNPVKHYFDVVHLAHGVTDAHLNAFMSESDVGINLHNEPYPTYENRCGVILAAGLLLISETLSPRTGLVPGVHYLEVDQPDDLYTTCRAVSETPHAFDALRRRGRAAAERFRASRVYERLVGDLIGTVAE